MPTRGSLAHNQMAGKFHMLKTKWRTSSIVNIESEDEDIARIFDGRWVKIPYRQHEMLGLDKSLAKF